MLLSAQGVKAGYGRGAVIKDVNLQLEKGQWLGLIGQNGVGKTTFLKSISGLVPLMSGRVLINKVDLSLDPRSARAQIGFSIPVDTLPRKLTGRQFLTMTASLRDCTDGDWPLCVDLIAELGLSDWIDAAIDTYSLGTRQKLAMAAALLGRPPLLIFDEVFNGLDPLVLIFLKKYLSTVIEEKSAGIILSTHAIDLVGDVCNKVALMQHGTIVEELDISRLSELREQPKGLSDFIETALSKT